jgi:hypothetical protein
VLKLQWRHIDFEARVVRLDRHTTKNDEGRTFPFTDTDALNEIKTASTFHSDAQRTAVRGTSRGSGELFGCARRARSIA